jgi:hypothetical protein
LGSALTSLFGRDFVVAHCVPAALFIALFVGILFLFGHDAPWAAPHMAWLAKVSADPEARKLITDATLAWLLGTFLGASWLLGLILSALNTQVVRFFEGYGTLNPLRILRPLERRRFRTLNKRADAFKARAREAVAAKLPVQITSSYTEVRETLATRFPDEEAHLLPTRFGNTVRSFEIYPRKMYGLEGVSGWFRLVAVVPKDYFAFINTARAQVDACVNVTLVLWVCIAEYVLLCLAAHGLEWRTYPALWLVALLLVWAYLAIRSASDAAVIWGEWVKSAFDVYLSDLRAKFLLDPFVSAEREREQWSNFSQAVVFSSAAKFPRRQSATPEAPPSPHDGILVGLKRWWFGTIRP